MKSIVRLVATVIAAAMTVCASGADVRYVFYFIGDGMGLGHVMTAESYRRTVSGSDRPLLMLQFPVTSVASTWSASSPITDSAAAGTALATGYKTNNGMLGVTPDSAAVTSIAATLHDDGWGVGIVTSVAADDATPAAFYAHQPSRKMFYEIGLDAAASGYEFIAGSNLRGADGTDLLEVLADSVVTVVRGLDDLDSVATRRVMLVSDDGYLNNNIGYTIDSVEGCMTLPAMTRACLSHLETVSPDRFFMMVEGGNIDHAAHGNDGGATVREIINFNEAIAVAYDFYKAHPDETLIVVTADHDTGGMSLGNSWRKYAADLSLFDHQRVSKEAFSDWCKGILKSRRDFSWDDMRDYLRANFGFWGLVTLSDEETARLKEKFDRTFELRNSVDQKTLYNSFNAFAVEVFDILNSHAGVGFTTTSHAGNLVPVYAVGVGADAFNGLNDNTEIPGKILKECLDR